MMHRRFYKKVWGSETWITNNPLAYMIKYLVALDTLSVQVHPCKDETWFILEAQEDSGVYLGLKQGLSKEEFREAVYQGRDLSSYLPFYPVSSGNIINVPSGTVHAIGKGIKLLEVQQNVDITYRGWDWNRLDNGVPRELHLDAFLRSASFEEERNLKSFFFLADDVYNHPEGLIVKTDHYSVFKHCPKLVNFELSSMAIDLVHLKLKNEKTEVKTFKNFQSNVFERDFLLVQ